MARAELLKILFLLFVSVIAFLGLGYFTERSNFIQLLLLFALAFAAYLGLIKSILPLKFAVLVAISFRLLLLFAWPALSDDYFRFIWDGRLLAANLNPYLQLPSFYLPILKQIPGLNLELYQQLNSPNYFTVYPPICQLIFAGSAWLSPISNWGMIVSIRFVLLLAELGTIYLIYKILHFYQKPASQGLWYILNPLVIIELTGNLHFEALLLFFLLAGLYLLIQDKLVLAGILFGLAIGVKLIPLLFMPFVLARLGWKKFFTFGSATALTLILLFLPFLSLELFQNLGQSLNLYFQKFEFNASIYYVFRWLGYVAYGYNNIAQFGPLLSLFTFLLVLYAAYQSRKYPQSVLPTYFLLALSIYFFLTTTVHPWYLTTLAALSIFTPYRYVIVWTGAAVLSYATYQTANYRENLFLTTLEYSLVFGWLLVELVKQRKACKQRVNTLGS